MKFIVDEQLYKKANKNFVFLTQQTTTMRKKVNEVDVKHEQHDLLYL